LPKNTAQKEKKTREARKIEYGMVMENGIQKAYIICETIKAKQLMSVMIGHSS
jgi:hypothetical protein